MDLLRRAYLKWISDSPNFGADGIGAPRRDRSSNYIQSYVSFLSGIDTSLERLEPNQHRVSIGGLNSTIACIGPVIAGNSKLVSFEL